MIQRRSQWLCFGFLLSDLLAICLAWLGAYYLRFDSGLIKVSKPPAEFNQCLQLLPLVLLLGILAFRLLGLYAIDRHRRFREEIVAVLQGVGLLTLFVLSALFIQHERYESRATLLLFSALTIMGVLTGRRIGWAVVRGLRARGLDQAVSLIVGSGRAARRLARILNQINWLGIHNVGFVDDQHHPLAKDLNLLGGFNDLPQLVERHQVGHVFIALPLDRTADARRVFSILSQSMVEVRMALDLPNLAGISLTTANLDGLPLIGLRESPHFGLNVVVKRVMDITLASLGLLMLAPIFALIAILVKRSSPGPIFYKQERCGLNGQKFQMLKFRSMRADAEVQTGEVWARKDDDRRTRLGEFLRRTSLDELPQLWNVLVGDMSLVGPRPERPKFVYQFQKTIPNYMARHCVKAGMTGWAQVNGWRGNTSLRKRVQFDLYYITHWTPWLDLKILWLTLFRGFVNKNAY